MSFIFAKLALMENAFATLKQNYLKVFSLSQSSFFTIFYKAKFILIDVNIQVHPINIFFPSSIIIIDDM